ncbi:hypothetical protein [Paraburkholderia caribensis]|uniref:hypothetical protein n=1 Tax=Paraburkholderia caribensis TaxID=75105 RepID=UPI0034D24246
MALDPNIALGVQPAQIQNPLTTFASVAALQNAQAQNQLTNLAIQQQQRAAGQTDAINEAYKGAIDADGTIDPTKLYSSVAGAGYGSAVPALQKTLTEAQTAQLAQQKTKLELGLQQVGALGQVLNGVTDQNSYTAALQHAVQAFGPQSIANLPTAYDPQLVAQKRNEALTVQQQLEEQHKQISDTLAQNTFAETQRHNSATEANAAGNLAVAQKNSATEAASAAARALEFDPKNGVVVNKLTGQSTPVMGANGQPIGGTANNLTQDQANAVAFGARALDAQNLLRQLEAGGTTNTNAVNRIAGSLPVVGGALGAATNFLNSDQQQSYDQAKRNFVSAVLRKESGAAISESEFANEDKKYFPQAGDTAATIEQKARARDLAIEGLKAQAGQGASLIPNIIASANQDYSQQPHGAQQQPAQQQAQTSAAPAQIPADAALAELRRRAANNPALAAKLQAMGH